MSSASGRLAGLRDRFFRFALERNPTISTFLGGDGWDVGLADANGRFRDARPDAIREELAVYRGLQTELASIEQATLDADAHVDATLLQAQIAFLIHQLDDLRYYERSVDTYVAEPFRGVDWQIQQMVPIAPSSHGGDGRVGTHDEWLSVVDRVRAVPDYIDVAIANLQNGFASGNAADGRVVERDGIAGSRAGASYFRDALQGIAAPNLAGSTSRATILAELGNASAEAAAAFERLATFLERAPRTSGDRYATGEAEYEWRLRNNLRIDRTAAELWQYGAGEVDAYRERLLEVAGEIGRKRSLGLTFGTENEQAEAVSAVIGELGKDAPADDDERLAWYVDAGRRAVEYGREQQLFDVPADYKLDVVPTPPLLRSTIDAAYYPAAPFKRTGVGRFYLTPTGNDPAALALNGRASIATVAAHEGFPGHDWHYRSLAEAGSRVSNIRWLTPGAVEDSSSMWSDSMSIEGWGLYAEELMGQPTDGRPFGFFSLEEQFYFLYWNLRRAMRVRVDVGLHTGRMSYDEAVDWWAAMQDFAGDARRRASTDPIARSILESADKNIYRYSKWPTQAITYNLGKASIDDLKARFLAKRQGSTARTFHEWYVGLGTVPAGYLSDLV